MDRLPLAGVRVLELGGGLSAAFCGRQLALWGAEVAVSVEQAAVVAAAGPTIRRDGRAASAAEAYLQTGKRRLTDSGRGLLDAADVVIGGFEPPGAAGWDDLAARRPGVVFVSISPFGLSGPRAGQDACIAELEALSGYLSLNGPADGPPLPAPARLLDYAIGANAFVGAMGGLIRQRRWGCGELVEVSGLETIAGLVPFVREQQQGHATVRNGGTPEGARLLPCRDGHVAVAPAIGVHLEAYREVLCVPDDVVIEIPEARVLGAGVDRVAAALAPYASRLSMEEVFLGLQVRGVVCGKVQSLDDVLADRQLEDLRAFSPQATALGEGRIPLSPARLDGAAPPAPAAREAPPAWAPRSDRGGDAGGPAPLEGLRVLDLTQAWIGPICGIMLADLGAEVIKVEGPARPDIWRHLGQAEPAGPRPLDTSCYFNAANRNKLGLTLDLGSPEGARDLLRLARGSDVVIENFTPRVLARLGLEPARLRTENPRLVVTSFSGFGAEGPHADFKANGSSIEGLAGWDALNLDHRGRPTLMGGYPADPICGLQMAGCTLVALYRSLATGEGGHVEGSMLEAACGYIGDALLARSLEARGCATVAWPEPAARMEAASGVDAWQVAVGERRTPVLSTLQALEEPQLEARGWFITLDTDGQGRAKHPGRFWRFDRSRLPEPTPPPRLGEHTDEVLRRLGG